MVSYLRGVGNSSAVKTNIIPKVAEIADFPIIPMTNLTTPSIGEEKHFNLKNSLKNLLFFHHIILLVNDSIFKKG